MQKRSVWVSFNSVERLVTHETDEVRARPIICVENDTVIVVVRIFAVLERFKLLEMEISGNACSLRSATARE
jgi:hypothetical protein